MSIAALEDVAAALREQGIGAEIIDVGDPDLPNPGINLRMADPHARYADDTLWPPIDKSLIGPKDYWNWGDRFQHWLPEDATVEEIVEAIQDTVRARA